MCIGLLVLFRTRFNAQGPLARTLSASAYAYIIHPVIIVCLVYALRTLPIYPLLKFAITILLAVPLCFFIANLIRKLPRARTTL